MLAVSIRSLTSSLNFSLQTHPSADLTKVKDLFAQHFPDVTSSTSHGVDDTKWLESALENLKMQLVSNKSSRSNTTSTNTSPIANNNNVTNNNHLNNISDVETNNLNNSAVNGDSNSSTSSAAENEIVLLQNAQLKTTVEEYKNIIAETVSLSSTCITVHLNLVGLTFYPDRKACWRILNQKCANKTPTGRRLFCWKTTK